MDRKNQRILAAALLAGALFLCAIPLLRTPEAAEAAAFLPETPVTVILDAGHGGEDGGASTADGVLESGINLEIALRLRDLLAFAGVDTQMIRDTDTAVYSGDCRTISQKKVSDLKNRASMVNAVENGLLVSIHQNYFEQTKYCGAQVFFAKTDGSKALAERIHLSLRENVDAANHRQCKPSQSVYLMEHIECTGVLIECGFLSNYEEAKRLQTDAYQKKLTAAICGAITEYLSEREERHEI